MGGFFFFFAGVNQDFGLKWKENCVCVSHINHINHRSLQSLSLPFFSPFQIMYEFHWDAAKVLLLGHFL